MFKDLICYIQAYIYIYIYIAVSYNVIGACKSVNDMLFLNEKMYIDDLALFSPSMATQAQVGNGLLTSEEWMAWWVPRIEL